MRYISPSKFLQLMLSNINNYKMIRNKHEFLLGSSCWMHSIQSRKYSALLTGQHFFIACRYETIPLKISKIIQAKSGDVV